MSVRMKLPHGEEDPRKRYSMPDPDALSEAYSDAYHTVFNGYDREPGTLSYSQAVVLLTLAQGYLDLTMYELGQECCVSKLRDIWRARRARTEGGSDHGE